MVQPTFLEELRRIVQDTERVRARLAVLRTDLLTQSEPGSRQVRSQINCILTDSLDPALQDLLKLAELDRPLPPREVHLQLPSSSDLTRFSDETRMAIYSAVVGDYFSPRVLDPATSDEVWTPTYGPDEAELQVVFLYGRWFVTWSKLDVPPDSPEDDRRELLLIATDDERPNTLLYREV